MCWDHRRKDQARKAILSSMGVWELCASGHLQSGLFIFIGISFVMGMNPFFHGVQTAIYQTRVINIIWAGAIAYIEHWTGRHASRFDPLWNLCRCYRG